MSLVFDCLDVAPERFTVAPTLTFRVRVTDTRARAIHAVTLRCEIRIKPRQRHYSDGEAGRLHDVFGPRRDWGRTLQPMRFADVSVTIPSFQGATEVDVPVVCTYDTEVAYSKYLHALADGEAPMVLLFSGTVFHPGANGFSVEPVSWDSEAECRMPVSVWRQLMDLHFPATTWLRLSEETFDELARYKSARALPTLDAAVEALLSEAPGQPGPPGSPEPSGQREARGVT